MKKNLLVTLADENYVEQAKQLFSSVYWNAGWKGDYMLLAYKIPEKKLKWFRDKGILIKQCKAVSNKKFKLISNKKFKRHLAYLIHLSKFYIYLNKFYLFTPEFKKWNNVVYLDADIIVKTSLDTLTDINRFAACSDTLTDINRFAACCHGRISRTFIGPSLTKIKKDNKILKKLKENYNLKEPGFNAGVIAFDTDIIKENTFSELKSLFKLYRKIHIYDDQSILNLFFYKNFIPLPYIYNCRLDHMIHSYNIKPEKIKGVVLHFVAKNKPWLPKNPFYKEWKSNLEKAELINLKKIPAAREKWTKENIEKYCRYLKKRHILYYHKHVIWKISIFFDKCLGLIGIFLKNNFPKLYYKLKKLEDRK